LATSRHGRIRTSLGNLRDPLAMYEAVFAEHGHTVLLHTLNGDVVLLTSCDFELLEDDEVTSVRRNITMAPSTGIHMRVIGSRE